MKIQIITFFNIFDISINHYELWLCFSGRNVQLLKYILFEHCIIACHVTSASFLLALLHSFFLICNQMGEEHHACISRGCDRTSKGTCICFL